MEDLASTAPGPMGWGDDTSADRLSVEQAAREKYAEQDPKFYMRAPKREPISQAKVDAVRQLMAADGMEGGISLPHIESLVFGDRLQWIAQRIGSCVGSAFMRLATWRMLWESFVLGDPEEIFGTEHIGTNNVAPFAPYGYRAGRKIGGLNSGDGSFCSAQIKGAKQYGILPCSAQGLVSDTFPEPQSTQLYRKWGNSNSLLEQFAPQAKQFQLQESEKVRDAQQAKELITEHFKPLEICSMWAFRPDYTHSDWELEGGDRVVVYKRDRGTSWAHAMSVSAIVQHGNQWFAIIVNSWGMRAHKNGDWFAIPLSLLNDWLADAECMSIGDIEMTDNVLPGDE